jgi:hypothetical protein
VSPIYVRPEREQAEHDRLIRFLQAQYSEKFEALANPGEERIAPVKLAAVTHFPDLVLNEDGRLVGLAEIETAASVNNLETMAKWVPFSRARVPFHLYVPVQGYEAALRLAEAHQVKAAEIWTYRPATEGFDLVRMFVDPSQALKPARPAKVSASKAAAAARTAAAAKAAPVAKAVAVVKPAQKAEAAKPVAPVAKKAVKVSRPAAKSAAKPAPKPVAKAKGKPAAAAKPSATRRPAAAPKRPAKPVRTSSAKPASKGGKKGAGARKGR